MSNFLKKGKEKNRGIAFGEMYDEVYDLMQLADLAENTHTRLYDIYFDETTDKFYVVGIRNDEIYRINIIPTYAGIMLGEFEKLDLQRKAKPKENKIKVYRGINDEMRWLSIASVAVLNRVGEIDSRELFDSFITYAYGENKFPVLNVYHEGIGSTIGNADFLHREGYVYIASGTFNADKFGKAFYQGLQKRNDWGNSIEYSPLTHPSKETFRLNDGSVITVPIYKKGINTGITILREKDAASLFTLHKSRG